jgi:ATP-dependent helicase/nuclease subunit B
VVNSGSLVLCSPTHRPVEALAALILAAQDGDVLAPVDVVVPSGLAGVTLRRAVAGSRGLANVRFALMPQLAERLCARHLALMPGALRRPLAPGDRNKAVQHVLASATGTGKLLAAAKRQRATARLLEVVFAELESAELDGTEAVAGLSGRGLEVLELYRLYRAQVAGLLTPTELLDLAVESVASGNAPDTHVVVMASGSLTVADKRLLAALGTAGRLSAVLPMVHTPATADWLHGQFDLAGGAAAPEAPAVTRLVVDPDAEEEVRIAVRTTLEHLASSGCRPERIGIAYRSPTPYVRLLAEQLTVSGIPHHVPSQRTLAQTVAGRTVLGLLSLHDRGFPRSEVLHWMADGPNLDTAGHRVPAARWDRLSREAGVSRDLDTWQQRLDRYARDHDQRADELPDDATDTEERRTQYQERAADARALLAEVEELHALAGTALTASNWVTASERLIAMLHRSLGARTRVDSWSGRASDELAQPVGLEQGAYDAVTTVLRSLAVTDVPIDPAAVVDAVSEAFAALVPSETTLGRGVLVGTLRSFAGADLDLLLVVGATEDALPARQRESTVLRDGDRALLSPELATVASRRTDEREYWNSALGSAKSVQLSYPRADTRSQRRQFASPWFLEQARRLNAAGEVNLISAAEVDKGDIQAAWFTSYPSFDASLREASTFASSHELDVAMSLHDRVDELALTDTRLSRGLDAARSRARGDFNAWTGSTGALPEPLRSTVDAHLSATTLQTWASCPTKHLYGEVLGVRDLEDRGGEDTIDAREKGTLFHGVLEALVAGHLGTKDKPGITPDTAWSAADIARARALLEADAAALTERGLTGREVLWTAQLARLQRVLVRVLAHDSNLRRQRRSWPIAVEAAFGRRGVAPLVVELPTQGPVPFPGYIDRIDATEADTLVVVDYKTGSGYGYDAIPKHTKPDLSADLVDRGRKLQLLLYGLAARQLVGLPNAEVQAWFWFVDHGDLHRGGLVDQQQEHRLKSVLDVVVGGIRGGIYPAYPGKERWFNNQRTWENCSYCPFDLVCPTTRAEQWNELRKANTVSPYAELVNPSAASA